MKTFHFVFEKHIVSNNFDDDLANHFGNILSESKRYFNKEKDDIFRFIEDELKSTNKDLNVKLSEKYLIDKSIQLKFEFLNIKFHKHRIDPGTYQSSDLWFSRDFDFEFTLLGTSNIYNLLSIYESGCMHIIDSDGILKYFKNENDLIVKFEQL